MDLDYNFVKIQELRKKAKQLETKTSYYSNPNLLDNWYFGNPVNQRGKTEYAAFGYCIDRWTLTSSVKAAVDNTGINLTFGGGYPCFKQYIENYKDFIGKTVTLSFLIDDFKRNDGVLYFVIQSSDSDWHSEIYSEAGMLTTTFQIPENATRLECFIQSQLATDDAKTIVHIIAAKLELGDTQTLAHKENGKWVLNEIPNFAEQMAICSQYNPETGEYVGTRQITYGTSDIQAGITKLTTGSIYIVYEP